MHVLTGIEIEAPKAEVLEALRNNREKHASVVAEARKGYMEQAEKALQKRLAALREGKLVALQFTLQPPKDHTDVYDTAIRMLELEQRDTVELDAGQVRNLVMDEWDWSQHFWASNAVYSAAAEAEVGARGYE